MLEVFAQLGGLDLSITTKSALVVRDLDLLRAIDSRSKISVNFSLITLNRRLRPLLEPARGRVPWEVWAPARAGRTEPSSPGRFPRLVEPGLRWARGRLSRRVSACNLLMMPVIPGLIDGPAAIESVVRRRAALRRERVWWRSLFLKPFGGPPLSSVRQGATPEVAGRIDESNARAVYAPRGLRPSESAAVFDRMRAKYGFTVDHRDRREPARGRRALDCAGTATSLGVR